jgi:hypothetical protein
MLLMESVWAVSARRAFDQGYRAGLREASTPYRLTHAEDIHNAAIVLITDEIQGRMRVASPDTSHGRAQRYALRMVMEALQSADAGARSAGTSTDGPRAPESDALPASPVRESRG